MRCVAPPILDFWVERIIRTYLFERPFSVSFVRQVYYSIISSLGSIGTSEGVYLCQGVKSIGQHLDDVNLRGATWLSRESIEQNPTKESRPKKRRECVYVRYVVTRFYALFKRNRPPIYKPWQKSENRTAPPQTDLTLLTVFAYQFAH